MSKMFPCSDPKVCGVQNHRPGTICSGARSAHPSNGKSIGGAPTLTSASVPATRQDADELMEHINSVTGAVHDSWSNGGPDDELECEYEEVREVISALRQDDEADEGWRNPVDVVSHVYGKSSAAGYNTYGSGMHRATINGKSYWVGVVYDNEMDEYGDPVHNQNTLFVRGYDQKSEVEDWVNDRATRDMFEDNYIE